MTTEHDTHDDLYKYDGYEETTLDLLSSPDVHQPRQDSAVCIEAMADAIHNEAVGTLFASQPVAKLSPQATPRTISREVVTTEKTVQPGPELSVFARYDARAQQRKKYDNRTICELRQWLERFKLPQAARVNDKGNFLAENEVSHHMLLRRSHSARATKTYASTWTSQNLTGDSTDDEELSISKSDDDEELSISSSDDDEANTISLDERLNLLLSVALPYSSPEEVSHWAEIQCVREDYSSIDCARMIRVELERRSAATRERDLETSVNNWIEAEYMRKCSESSWRSDNVEASVIQELEHGARLAEEMFRMILFEDSNLYVIPRLWDFTDLPRRTRLYGNTNYLLNYLRRERSVVSLIHSRLDDLREGRSRQSEVMIAKEVATLENALKLRNDVEEDYLNLLCDFLDWAIAHTTLEFQDSINGGPKPTRRNALTDDIPLAIVEDVIEAEPELNSRYEKLRNLEELYFPERFIVMPLSPEQPYHTPSGRQIPVRKPTFPHSGLVDGDYLLDEPHFGERLTRTLPRSFKPMNFPLLRVQNFDPHPVPTLDKKMRGEPTSPVNPPESDYLRPPRPIRKPTLRMQHYPHKIEEYSPSPLVPLKMSKSTSASKRYEFHTDLDTDEPAFVDLQKKVRDMKP